MKSTRFQMILAVILSLLMVFAVMPLTAFAADDGLTYIRRVWDSESKTVVETVEPVPGSLRSFPGECEGGGWYYIGEDKTCNDRVTIPNRAVVNLVLAPGVTLNCKNGIYVSKSSTLNVYGSTDDSGTLTATGSSGNSGIGGNNGGAHGAINFYGGTVNATGGSHGAGVGTGEDAEGACDAICFFGGKVTARGGQYAAGVGGGDESTGAQIVVYGGTVDATGGEKGAGVGGGCDRGPSLVTIWGGTVLAEGGKYGAGIGEGYDASSDTSSGRIEIRNCKRIWAGGGFLAAGIGGGGYNNTKIKIYIYGGEDIDACGGDENDCGAAGIGSGAFREVSDMVGRGGDFEGTISISGGKVFAAGSGCFAGSSGTNNGAAGIGSGYGGNMTGSITVSGGQVIAEGAYGGAAIGAGSEDQLGYGGECEGNISILGGALQLITTFNNKDDKAVVIGHGYDGDENGNLTLGQTMRVTKVDETVVSAGQRVSTCQTATNRLYVTECPHDDSTYTQNNEQTHVRKCNNCLYNAAEDHFFHDGPCVCGAEGCGVFFFVDDEVFDARMSYGQGGTVEPPEDPRKDGFIFGGWYSYFDYDFEELYDFDEPIYEDVYLSARWLAKFELSVYDRTTEAFGVGGTVAFSGQEEYGTYSAITDDPGGMIDAAAKADEGYDFVGWAYRDTIDTIYIPTTGFSIRLTENSHLCAVFEKHVHTPRFESGYDPECEYDGEIDHYKCTKCKKLLSDEDCLNELTEEDIRIPAIRHDWDEPGYEWADDYSSVFAWRVCKNDEDHFEYEFVGAYPEITKPATCEEKGETTYTTYGFSNEAFKVQSVTVADIDATGHTYEGPEWSWAEDHGRVTAIFTCHCGDKQEVTADAEMTEVSAATATDDQVVKYTATVTFGGLTYTAETGDITVPGTATGTPDEPSGGNICKWDNADHGTSFFGRLIRFFHSILYFFAHLFGKK